MKQLVLLWAVVFLLAATCGCSLDSYVRLVDEPMDAAVFDVLDADTQAFFADFTENPPVSMTVNYDQHYAPATVEDAELMKQMYDAISKIHITAKTEISSTDGYHRVTFAAADGSTYNLSFENQVLCENGGRYVLEDAESFWRLFKDIAEKYSEE